MNLADNSIDKQENNQNIISSIPDHFYCVSDSEIPILNEFEGLIIVTLGYAKTLKLAFQCDFSLNSK